MTETNTEWKVGDVVQLKSGSPPMTVQTVNSKVNEIGMSFYREAEAAFGFFSCKAEMLKRVPEVIRG